ncbi:MAG: haloacid dehalogenase-like hydrolase [Deltaproteobacteria bacterium]|nr:haloacid dehalogenase-like hydrolase [Deltaproteobacteria bacterium]
MKSYLPTPLCAVLQQILRPGMSHGPGRRNRKRSRPSQNAAAFDGDGTLWAGDVGEGFFQFLLDRGYYDGTPTIRKSWKRYQEGSFDKNFTGEDFYEMMVTGLAGHKINKIRTLADEYFQLHAQRIFRPMVALVQALKLAKVDVYVVSGSPLWVVEAGARYFNIPREKVLGLEPVVDAKGVIQRRVKRVKVGTESIKANPWNDNKPKLLRPKLKGKKLVLAAGNGPGDWGLLELVAPNRRVFINHKGETSAKNDMLDHARKNKWIILDYNFEHEALAGMGVPDWTSIPQTQPLAPKEDF